LIGAIGFAALDTFQHWTPLGDKIYNFFWPPTLSIDSVPSGASVSLVNDNGEDVIRKNAFSPAYVSKILPGNYTLILKKEGYKDIERRITVFGIERGKQDIRLEGMHASGQEKKQKVNLITIPFEIGLEINSFPEGADVYIDGNKLPGKTPLIQNMKVGEHTIKLVKEGFNVIGNVEKTTMRGQCNLNLIKDASDQEGVDRRYWDISSSVLDDGLISYILKGTFWKEISLDSRPQGAAIYVDDSKSSWGTTPQKISIKIGEYKIKLEKPNFQEWVGVIKVDADTEIDINPILKKWVYFYSYGEKKSKKDINAAVYIEGTKINGKKTPFKYPLVIKEYEVTFKKHPKYESRSFKVNINDRKVVKATLKQKPISLKIVVKNFTNEYNINNAYILINNKWVGRTDKNGVWKSFMKAGEYKIKIGKQKEYETAEVSKRLNWGQKEITLFVSLAPISKNKEKLFEKGQAYYKKGKWLKAQKTLNEVLKVDPENKTALKYLARVNKEIAKEKGEKIKRKTKIIFAEAKENFKDKKWLRAYDKYSQVLNLGPDDKSMINDSRRYIKYINKKMDNIAQGVTPVDRSKDLFYAIAFCYYREGDFKLAVAEWERVLTLDSRDPEVKEFIKKVKKKM
ncbi:PEGA domain-containing protein, partial [bacterium]|nr:PEGA domain-containing protein [bacterium]